MNARAQAASDLGDTGSARRLGLLRSAIAEIARILPTQGPIGVFVAQNPLASFEHLPFEQAIVYAGELYGAQPYPSEGWYDQLLAQGRITADDVERVLATEPPLPADAATVLEVLGASAPAFARGLLVDPIRRPDEPSIRWLLEERALAWRFMPNTPHEARTRIVRETTAWLSSFVERKTIAAVFERLPGLRLHPGESVWTTPAYDERCLERSLRESPEELACAVLWAGVREAAARLEREQQPPQDRPRSLSQALAETTARSLDDEIAPLLISLSAAFVDQGVAYWPMPDRELGFYVAVRQLLVDGPPIATPLLATARRLLRDEAARSLDAHTSLLESLEALGIPDEEMTPTLRRSAVALAGWAGLMRRLEEEPELASQYCPPCALADFLAVRLVLERAAAIAIGHEALGQAVSLCDLTTRLGQQRSNTAPGPASGEPPRRRLAYVLLQVAERLGLSGPRLLDLPLPELACLLDAVERFDGLERRRLLHRAYEHRLRDEALAAVATHRRDFDRARPSVASLQVAFCIDDREESIRRHLEEVDPSIETFGAAGFFGIPIAFRGLDDGTHAALCPVVAKPSHRVEEVCRPEDAAIQRLFHSRRKLWAALSRGTFVGSRSLLRGYVATLGIGLLSMVPLVVRVLFPRGVSALERRLRDGFFPKPRTELAIRRAAEEQGDLDLFPEFTQEEMADRVARVLQDIGLLQGFARLVAVIGHGSSSLNNPHESAYDCGACGGRRGGPNARLFARMANHAGVRKLLIARGITLPDSTVFVGGVHDTCNDAVEFFDLDAVPASHTPDLTRFRQAMDQARARNAHERCRRFESASLGLSVDEALRHVEGRAEDLAQPRPELGHATNAMAVFGRRALTRGLFLDRRSFLVSYDPLGDPTGAILGRLLGAMVPVAVGINLAYYFSFVDRIRYGCGTKLPHNVTGLVGVMNGHLGDLLVGLPWQTVELHEPVRLVVVLETTAELLAKIAEQHPAVGQVVRNGWIHLALMHPTTGELTRYHEGTWVPVPPLPEGLPTTEGSLTWYRGQRGNLPFARIESVLQPPEDAS